MQFTLLALSALAASVFAVPQADTTTSTENLVSVLSVLETALPSSLVAEALTNSAAVSSEIASEFSAGQTPTWFTALPSDIQTFLVPLPSNTSATAYATTSAAISRNLSSIASAQSSIISSGRAANSSAFLSASSVLRSSASVASSSAARSSASAASSAAAASSSAKASSTSSSGSMPTAIIGMGLAGAVGLVGVLAL